MNQVHKKLVKRWAEIYLDKVEKEGRDKAGEWANRTIPPESALAVRKAIKEIKGVVA